MADKYLSLPCLHCNGSGMVMANTMGLRIRALRLKAHLTQPELSYKVKGIISAKNIGNVEQGQNQNPPLLALREIAKVFGVPVGYLIDGVDYEDPLS